MLPAADGIELMQSVPEMSDLPVIFISAYGRDETVVRAARSRRRRLHRQALLGRGAHRQGARRAAPACRRRALRARRGSPSTTEQRRVTVAGRAVHLTPTEYELLRILAINAGRVVTYASLLRQLWANGEEGDTEPVRGVVKRLRRKLGEDPASPAWIFNERGVGYRMPRPGDG